MDLSTPQVVAVEPESPAAGAGLRAGDVVQSINGTAMSHPSDVVDALTDPGRRVNLDVLRGGQLVSLRFRL